MSPAGGSPILAAGTVVRREGPAGPEVLLVHRPRYDDWSFPKGKLDREEPAVLGAVRETAEETGLRVRVERPLPTQRYSVAGRPKQVRYWVATARDGSFSPNEEVDEVAWLPLTQARDRLSWSRDARLVDALVRGPLHTNAVLVLRHCQAVARADWDGEDDTRPLDAAGAARSAALAPVLDAYAPRRVICSDTVRALETVKAYAALAQVTVEISPLLGNREPPPAQVAGPELASYRESGSPVLLCTHGAVVPPLLATLLTGAGRSPAQPELALGALWCLHFTAGRLVAAERHPED